METKKKKKQNKYCTKKISLKVHLKESKKTKKIKQKKRKSTKKTKTEDKIKIFIFKTKVKQI